MLNETLRAEIFWIQYHILITLNRKKRSKKKLAGPTNFSVSICSTENIPENNKKLIYNVMVIIDSHGRSDRF